MGWQDINDFSAVSDRFDPEVAMMKRVFPQVELCEVHFWCTKNAFIVGKCGEHHDRPIQSLGFWGSLFYLFSDKLIRGVGSTVLNWLAILLLEELMLGEWQSDLWKIQFDLGPGLK